MWLLVWAGYGSYEGKPLANSQTVSSEGVTSKILPVVDSQIKVFPLGKRWQLPIVDE